MKRLGWSGLNKSQQQAVTNCVGSRTCQHECTVKLVWGPPGTGKTSTVAFLLHFLLKERHPTVTCAPTNVAVLEVAERLVRRVTSKGKNRGYGLGDVVLFGNGDRMQMDHHDELRAVFLDCRVDMLTGCFASKIGWRDSLAFMISLLNEGSVGEVSELKEKKPLTKEKDKRHCYGIYNDYLNSFDHLVGELKLCIEKLCKNLPTSVLSLEVVRSMFEAGDTLTFLQTVLRSIAPEELMHLFSIDYDGEDPGVLAARDVKRSSLSLLRSLSTVLDLPFYGEFINRKDVMKYSLEKASLVFCTVSGTAKLHALGVSPWQFLVIDEAAQLKECESAIPLQLPHVRHVVLVGDERQLPALVKSKVCEDSGFGRSLFERLASLGQKKHLLNVQHRMHPSISLFPNNEFYRGKILDGQNVKLRSYSKRFLRGKMFDSYSFINVGLGKEAGSYHSKVNMVEVAVVSEIVARLNEEAKTSKKKVRVGVLSPYNAQVYAIAERLGHSYSSDPRSDFSVSIRSVDGFQGGEEDVVIISTVRSNSEGDIGFLYKRQRANVALTRARYCLWIVGNSTTLSENYSVWRKLVENAKGRGCFHEADQDKGLACTMVASLMEHKKFQASNDLVSLLFRDSKWKVCFDEAFWTSMARVGDFECCKEVLLLVEKLSGGWFTGQPAELVERYLVKERYLIWAVDVETKISVQTQILKVYGVAESSEVTRLSSQLYEMYGSYSPEKTRRCKHRRTFGDIVVPESWPVDSVHDEADVLSFLSNPLASLSLLDRPETSSPRSPAE